MTKSTLILLCIAFTIGIAILTLAASAQCSSCMKEGDWGESAKNFIEGKPIDDTPQLFGPKAERQKNSQLASDSGKAQESANNTSNAAPINTSMVVINLASISAKPSSVNTAVFEEMSLEQSGNGIVPDNNDTSTIKNETLVTAFASIRGITGTEIGKVDLIKSSGNEYRGVWKADVPEGIYNVTLAASSPQASETFADVQQIAVINAKNGGQ
jgi:hypothetical protein